jgi:hypothetical protein
VCRRLAVSGRAGGDDAGTGRSGWWNGTVEGGGVGRKEGQIPTSARRSFNECPSHLLVCGGAPQTLLKWGRFPNPEEFMPREVKPEACTVGATSP